jgi:hypothetical protein
MSSKIYSKFVIMIYIRMIIAWYVVVIHFITRAFILEVSKPWERHKLVVRTEKDYFKWEGVQIHTIYLLPYLAFFTCGFTPFVITSILCIFVSILRSIEHINPKIIG